MALGILLLLTPTKVDPNPKYPIPEHVAVE